MSYNALNKPRFYINSIEYLYNKGLITSIDPIFLSSSWHSPKTYPLVQSTDFGFKKEFIVKLKEGTLLNDFNYIIILGHNLNSSGSSFRCIFRYQDANSAIASVRSFTDIQTTSNTSQGGFGG